MFRGFTGCMLAGGAVAAGAVLGSLLVMLGGAAAGILIAAASCQLGAREDKLYKQAVPYPSYKY